MKQLDPTHDSDWDRLSDIPREFYYLCVDALFDERELIEDVLSNAPRPGNNVVDWQTVTFCAVISKKTNRNQRQP